MARKYEMKRRAESQAETRRRIVEAAIDLHETIGPARTTVSAIAERAGVQRHTYYRHFPEERSLHMACSGLYMQRNPPPDIAPWRAIADPVERLETALGELYDFYAANEAMFGNVTRDAEVDPLIHEIVETQFGPFMAAIAATLGAGQGKRRRAIVELAIAFTTWRSLVRGSGLSGREAVAAMVGAFAAASGARRTRSRRRRAAPPRASARSARPGG